MVDKLKKIRTDVKGLSIKNGSYFLERMIKKERLRRMIGRVGSFSNSANEDKVKAEDIALNLVRKVTDHGLASIEGIGATPILTSHDKGLTLAEVLEDYITKASKYGTPKTQGKPIAPQTIRGYRELVKHAWSPLMNLPIASINKELLRKWYMDLVDEGFKNNWSIRHNEALRKLARIFTWAMNEEWLEINVAKNLFMSQLKVANRKVKEDENKRFDLKTNEIGRFIYSLLHTSNRTDKQNSETSRDLLLTYILTGGRYGEIKQMQWDWFKDKTSEDAFNSFTSPAEYTKTSKPYFYPCCVLLKELFAKRYKNREALAEKSKSNSALRYVFPDRLGRKHLEDVRGKIDMVCADAGITKRVGYHFFRFTFQGIIAELTNDAHLRIRAMHHTSKDITESVYGNKNIDDNKLRYLFQDVEDFLSNTLPLTARAYSGEDVTLDGTEKLGKDNRTMVDKRINDKEALRDIVFGRRKAKYIAMRIPEVQKINLEYLRKEFPTIPDNYFELQDNLPSLLKDAKRLFNSAFAVLEDVRKIMGNDNATAKEIMKYVGNVEKLRPLRKLFNIKSKEALKETSQLLRIVNVEKYVQENILNKIVSTCEKLIGKEINSKPDNKLKHIENIAKLLTEKFAKETKDKKEAQSNLKILNLLKRVLDDRSKIELTIKTLRTGCSVLSMPNPILDQYYINQKEQHKDTKDNTKIIWLRNVKTSIDASNNLPTSLEVK